MSQAPAPDYFDQLYQHSADPWQVQERWYERRKQALLLASLPRQRYRHAFEPACGTGALTMALAERCDQVLASDGSADAVRIARQKTSGLPNVQVQHHALPADWPDQTFDLIVLSEWAYYLSAQALVETARRCQTGLAEDGTLIACHWRHAFEQRVQTTDQVHVVLHTVGNWARLVRHEEQDFLLEAWSPRATSVAQQEGLA